MFQGFTQQTIDFMWALRFNNEKRWFEAHKDEYKTVLEKPMHLLAREVFGGLGASRADPALHLHISRIYRDARRLRGEGPYKDHLWFTLRPQDEAWTDKPVFWFELAPETWSYGLGYYRAKPLTMSKLRARIDGGPEPLAKLNRTLLRQDEFILEGDDYARPKREAGLPLAEWYNKKTFSLIHEEPIGEAVFSPALTDRIVQGFSFLLPFYRYFVTLDEDPAPEDGRLRAEN
ncbi:MAG TPA: DUF2461 domain-containing protein [Clostridiales bacterium]|nr:DUF2461 domain-containing protein [Clostridiales bacterium]